MNKIVSFCLKDLEQIEELSNSKIGIFSLTMKKPKVLEKILRYLDGSKFKYLLEKQYEHISLGFNVLRDKKYESVFIVELFSWHSQILLILLLLSGKNIYILLMWDQQLAKNNQFKYYALRYLKLFLRTRKFKIVQTEIVDDVIEKKYRINGKYKFAIPMPSRADINPTSYKRNRETYDDFNVGVLGVYRNEKNNFDNDFLKLIKNFTDEYNYIFYIGTPLHRVPEDIDLTNYNLVDTTSQNSYLKYLDKIDVIILNYDLINYYYRSSGIIMDALNKGVYVICPNFPVFKNQISWPTKVGDTYDDLSQIPSKILSAKEFLDKNGIKKHLEWSNARNIEKVYEIIEANL